MTLLSAAYEPFYFIEKRFTPDGAGGMIPTWAKGAEFMATANFPNSSLSQIADKLTEKTNCTITTSRDITLDFMDVIQRKEDGVYFRILSNGKENKTPKSAGLDMRQSRAEVWTPPDIE
jgi:hypothetical protein